MPVTRVARYLEFFAQQCIRFVEDQQPNRIGSEVSQAEQLFDPSRCSNGDVAAFEMMLIVLQCGSTDECMYRAIRLLDCFDHLNDLLGDFTCGTENDHPGSDHRRFIVVVVIRLDRFQCRDTEDERLARTRLGLDEKIESNQC